MLDAEFDHVLVGVAQHNDFLTFGARGFEHPPQPTPPTTLAL
jgi:hypothetical protein